MLKNTNKYQTLLAVCLLTLSACSTNETLTDSPIDQSKTPIELTAGIIGENAATTRGLTRTVITNDSPYGSLAEAFSKGTSLYMVIKSENETSTTSTQYTRTIGYAQETAPTPANSTTTGFASAYQRYWEDTQSPARSSMLSIYAACVPGYYLSGSVYPTITPNGVVDGTTWSIGGSTDYSNTWNANLGTATIAWPLRSAAVGSQDATFLANQDLCFSNNVSNHTSDERLAFNTTTNKFTSGRMVFHHALTQVVFKIIKGEGFGTGTGVFNFTNSGENIVLTGFNTAGKLDISTGDFSNIDNTTPITSLASSTEDGFAYVLTCLMLPGSALTSDNLNEIYFTIDNNLYHIKKSDLATALNGNDKTVGTGSGQVSALTSDSKMRPGVKYIFTMTVSKKGIDKLSASVVPWEEVEAEQMTPSNARISVSVMTNGTKQTGATALFDLYRSANVNTSINDNWVSYEWGTGYTSNKAQLSENTTVGEYTAYVSGSNPLTPWYWPDNKTFYHFRTVMPKDHTVTQAADDYLTLTGAPSYTDVCWGAPFSANANNLNTPLNGEKLHYSTTSGFDNTGTTTHQISRAIGPTTDPINMMMFHMMSDVTINLTTTTGNDAVNLNGATISLSNIHPTGTVLMGNGLVTATGTPGAVSPSLTYNSTNNTSKVEHYGFVPQSLEDVVLTITTADNNRYIVDMKDVEFSALSFNSNLIANPYEIVESKCKINRWYPNFKYTYTFQLKKTGIESISATINDWENISADPQTVQIK